MLFSCPCIPFNRKNNKFRKEYRAYINNYIKSIIEKTNYTILLIIVEAGGLLDEYHIILNLYKHYQKQLPINIIIIEPHTSHSLSQAQTYFIDNLNTYVFDIKILKHINLKEIKANQYETIIVTSFDPYYFTIDTIFKNIIDDIKMLSSTSYYLMINIFYTKLNQTIWDIFLWNEKIYKTYLLKQTITGQNNVFLYTKQHKYKIHS